MSISSASLLLRGGGFVSEIVAVSDWGWKLYELSKLSDTDLARRDIAELNLLCAEGLPGAPNLDNSIYLSKIDEWTELVRVTTNRRMPQFRENPNAYGNAGNTEARFRIFNLLSILQRRIGIRYNYSFMEGDFDGSDSRNLFIHGVLTGFGGTCNSLPVLESRAGGLVRGPAGQLVRTEVQNLEPVSRLHSGLQDHRRRRPRKSLRCRLGLELVA